MRNLRLFSNLQVFNIALKWYAKSTLNYQPVNEYAFLPFFKDNDK